MRFFSAFVLLMFLGGCANSFSFSSQKVVIQNNIQGAVVTGITVAGGEVPGELHVGEKISVSPGFLGWTGNKIELTASVYDAESSQFLGVARTTIQKEVIAVPHYRYRRHSSYRRRYQYCRYYYGPISPWIISQNDIIWVE